MKATFFITYIMIDGWAGIAAEILRLAPLITFHVKNTFLVKTEQDRQNAMDPGSLEFATSEPRIQLYFMLGHVYAPVTPRLHVEQHALCFCPLHICYHTTPSIKLQTQNVTNTKKLRLREVRVR